MPTSVCSATSANHPAGDAASRLAVSTTTVIGSPSPLGRCRIARLRPGQEAGPGPSSGLAVITFFKAILLGFSVAAPVGPIGILCIRRTLADGRRVGLACGLGAATADALYGLI